MFGYNLHRWEIGHDRSTEGLEVLRRLMLGERACDLPAVISESSKQDRDLAQAHRLGVNSFISKPVGFEALMENVAQLGPYWLVVSRSPG